MAQVLKAKNLIDLSIDEIKLLKDLINKVYNHQPLVVKQACEFLDLVEATKAKEKKKAH